MALFMDVHTIEGGVSANDVAAAHEKDVATQGEYGVRYLRYWLDEAAGKIFCLVEAPDADAANTVHSRAHGLVADEIYPVSEHSQAGRVLAVHLLGRPRIDRGMRELVVRSQLHQSAQGRAGAAEAAALVTAGIDNPCLRALLRTPS